MYVCVCVSLASPDYLCVASPVLQCARHVRRILRVHAGVVASWSASVWAGYSSAHVRGWR